MKTLNLVLGDQLDFQSAIFEEFEPEHDAIWMAEANGENTHVKHHKHQIIMFLAAMRHFAADQEKSGRTVHYTRLSADGREDRAREMGQILGADLKHLQPQHVRVVRPGDRRVLKQLQQACQEHGLELEVLEDTHFFTTPEDFAAHAEGRKNLRLEFFYRELRKRYDYLMDDQGDPLGSQWNFDADNRETFGKRGPEREIPSPLSFQPTEIVREVQQLVRERYPDHPGSVDNFRLPVTREQALELLEDFVLNRLANFGDYQDAMWTGEFFLYHSRLSSALNIKLLHSAEVCDRAQHAYHQGAAPINAVEGFIRQILGWREYIRGIYWQQPENYRSHNYLKADNSLPGFFWSGKTDMNCLAHTLKAVHDNAYSHHIQRLMVLGLFCLLYGVNPEEFNDWHLATHCDAIDWVSVPNVIGMSQYADGGLLASKPYCASGNYIHKMSNYCAECRYHPKKAVGEQACPFTSLYWSFLNRHRDRLKDNGRLKFQFNNLNKKSQDEIRKIEEKAREFKVLWSST